MAGAAGANKAADGTGFRVDDLVIDIGSQRVMRGEREIPLPQLSFEFLLALTRAAPNVLSVDQLMERVWPGLVVGPETVSQRVKLVREALGDDSQAPRYIAGVRGRGYRMLARVTPLDETAATSTASVAATTSAPPAPTSASLGNPTAAATPPVDPRMMATSVAGTVTTAVNVAAAAGAALPSIDDERHVPMRHATSGVALTFDSLDPLIAATGAGAVTTADSPAQPPPRSPSSQRHWLALAAVAAVLVVGLFYVAQRRGWIEVSPGLSSTLSTLSSNNVQLPKTIAVLPLIDISPGGGSEYLGDGLAEELTDRLTRIPGVRVASRTSAFAFKGKPADVREIAQSLAVRHVLEGSVRREGNRLRVTAQLIDAESGYHVWSNSYDRQWKDLLDIQDDLARSIVSALQLVLSSEIIERLDDAKGTSLEAFDLYLAGLAKLGETSTGTQLEEAERIFQASLSVDPKFARGYAGLCETYAAGFRRSRDSQLATKAEAACNQALKLDGSLHEVEQALARLYVVSGRADRAIEIFKKFLARNPSDADAFIGLAQAYENARRPGDAEFTFRRAIDADPSYARPHLLLGNFLFKAGRNKEAVEHYRRATVLTPTSPRAFSNLGGALQLDGDFEGAARALERSLELEPTQLAFSNTGTLYFYMGRFEDAEKMYLKATELTPRDQRTWANLADTLFQMKGRAEDARKTYERTISLAQLELRMNPNDPDTLARLAYYNARVGNLDKAREFIAKASAVPTDSFYVHYYIALGHIEDKNPSAALDALEKAVALGYSVQLVRSGPEFAKIRGERRFQQLVASSTRHSAG